MQLPHLFTSATVNYIPKARVLANSVKKQHPNIKFHLILSDILPESINQNNEPFDSIITIDELPIPNLKSWIFKHSVVELCTAVKGVAFQEIIQRYQCDKILYFDPDIVVFSPLDNLVKKLDQYSILLTPHLTVPHETNQGIIHHEISSLKHGVYNLGFLGVKDSEEAKRFLSWWSKRCLDFCYDDVCNGLFTDQRWIDWVPAFFRDFEINREPIYNVAYWNLNNRVATGSIENGILINGEPICFYHFSSFDSGGHQSLLEQYGASMTVLFELLKWYRREINAMGQDELGQIPYHFSCFDNGEPITKHQRRIYRVKPQLSIMFPDPFDTKEKTNSYLHWYKKNYSKYRLLRNKFMAKLKNLI